MKKSILIMGFIICLLLSACAAIQPSAETEDANMTPTQAVSEEPEPSTASADEVEFFDKVKDYIISGQEDLPEAGRLHWSPAFLDKVDFETTYQNYLNEGGKEEDVLAYATYLTDNSPAPDNWKELFEKDLMDAYSQTVERYEDLGDGIYQVYVKIDDAVVPYVAVNSRTGWYHG